MTSPARACQWHGEGSLQPVRGRRCQRKLLLGARPKGRRWSSYAHCRGEYPEKDRPYEAAQGSPPSAVREVQTQCAREQCLGSVLHATNLLWLTQSLPKATAHCPRHRAIGASKHRRFQGRSCTC